MHKTEIQEDTFQTSIFGGLEIAITNSAGNESSFISGAILKNVRKKIVVGAL